jgi:hypothetical protein
MIMPKKLQWILPAIQVPLAAGLVLVGYQQQHDWFAPPWVGRPATLVCYGINAPAVPIYNIAYRSCSALTSVIFSNLGLHDPSFSYRLEAVGLLLVAVFVLWYATGLEIDNRLVRRIPAPRIACGLLVLYGVTMAYAVISSWLQQGVDITLLRGIGSDGQLLGLAGVVALHRLWVVAFHRVYGRDLFLTKRT